MPKERCCRPVCFLVSLSLCLGAWARVRAQALPDAGAALVPRVLERGPNHDVVLTSKVQTGEGGRPVQVPATYTVLADGLNYWDEDAKGWAPARAEIEVVEGIGVARHGQQQVVFAANVNEEDGAITVSTREGVTLRSSILALAYYDAASGKDAILATVKDTVGEWVPPNQIIYRDAFDGLLVDVVYTYRISGLEQDLILREGPPDPEDFGLLAEVTRLEVLTEFFSAPSPTQTPHLLDQVTDPSLRNAMAAPDWVDEELDFGGVRMLEGRALTVAGWLDPKDATAAWPIAKRWLEENGRTVLIESADYWSVADQWNQLPPSSDAPRRPRQAANGKGYQSRLSRLALLDKATPSAERLLPQRKRLVAATTPAPQTSRPAIRQATRQIGLARGLVLDYSTLTGSYTNYTFQADQTYYLTNNVTLSGTATFEGGAVIKSAPGKSLQALSAVTFATDRYRPVIFTARDDDTVGQKLTDSGGNPSTNYYGSPALRIQVSGQSLGNVRFAYASTGLYLDSSGAGTAHIITNAQFEHCSTAVRAVGTGTSQSVNIRNALFDQTTTALQGYAFTIRAEHLTVDQCTTLVANDYTGYESTLCLTNSLLSGARTNTTVSQTSCEWPSSGAYSTVGAAAHYLAAGSSYRDAGTTNINAALATELRNLTTYPPTVVSNVTLSGSVTWAPQAGRDTDLPDLGYHYPPLDYAVTSAVVGTNCDLTISSGTAIAGFGDFGLVAENYGKVTAAGAPDRLIWCSRYNAVQEQSVFWGSHNWEPMLITGPPHATLANSVQPSLDLRFVAFSQTGGYGYSVFTMNDWYALLALTLRDCQFFGGNNYLSSTYQYATTIDLKNNLFRRVFNYCYGWPTLSAYNNLFWGGTNYLQSYSGAPFVFRDNAFHGTGLGGYTNSVTMDHNAYLGSGQGTLVPLTPNDVQLTSFNYATGPLGGFYHSTTNLIARGSRTCGTAGLYWHTVKATTNTYEGNDTPSTVDIGFHYVGVDASNAPRDDDGDGLPNWLEDSNGDGDVDSGEGNWNNGQDAGLTVKITRPSGTSPTP